MTANLRLKADVLGDEMYDPIIRRGTQEQIQVSFDQMTHEPSYYSYSVYLCNADWTLSNLMEIEYLVGFNQNTIDNSDLSFNTTFDYTHYYFLLPNDNIKFLVSGNYVVKIYETDYPDKILATACFSIDENLITISGNVKGSTVMGVNTIYQQLNLHLDCSENTIVNPSEELKLLVRQNGRSHNESCGDKHTYVQPQRLIY